MRRQNNSEFTIGRALVLLAVLIILVMIINLNIRHGDITIVQGEVTDTSISLRPYSQNVVIDGKIITVINAWDFYKMEKGEAYEVEVSKIGDTYYFVKVIRQID